jgi:hypothetical protein
LPQGQEFVSQAADHAAMKRSESTPPGSPTTSPHRSGLDREEHANAPEGQGRAPIESAASAFEVAPSGPVRPVAANPFLDPPPQPAWHREDDLSRAATHRTPEPTVASLEPNPGVPAVGAKPVVSGVLATPLVVPAARRAPEAEPTRASAPAPTIHVTIGRIEVRASTPPAKPVRGPKAATVMSLEEYLRRRAKGGAS